MKVAADPEAPPFLSKSADGGWQGFEYGIMLAISDRAGASVRSSRASSTICPIS
jgi:hypothetical protein